MWSVRSRVWEEVNMKIFCLSNSPPLRVYLSLAVHNFIQNQKNTLNSPTMLRMLDQK